MIKSQTLILCFIPFLFSSTTATKPTNCNRSCPGGLFKRVPYPFGFSVGCEIQFNCSASDGAVLIGEFPVQKLSPDGILVNVPVKCGRAVETLRNLYSENYAPTSHNAILMENCTAAVQSCMIPQTMLQTHLDNFDCGGTDNSSVSCYSEMNKTRMFLDYDNVTKIGCRSLFSGVSSEMLGNSTAVSLDVQTVQLGWWLQGNCDFCHREAVCTKIMPPGGRGNGFRCQCPEGMIGNGYSASSGCRKESSGCNLPKYLSGHCGGTTRIGVLIGGVVVGASIIVCIGLICCFIRRHTIANTKSRKTRKLCEASGITIPIYPYKAVEKATNSFSDKQRLGTGAYGTVYSGKLPNGDWVAIKRIKHRPDTEDNNIDKVMNEIKLLSSVSHPNLVRLLGCSIDKDEQILVYEFMPNGTLAQHLQRDRGHGLTWPVRLTIAAETAQAISFLHSSMNPPIYHRDVKSSNILLDYNYKTKVADFGLSRLGIIESSHISTAPQGTPGYLDPEYHQNFHLSDKSDVYSFGVVLVEIITGLKAVDFSRRPNEVNLASLAVDRIGRGSLDEIIDPFLEPDYKDEWTFLTVNKVAEIAFRCLAFHSDMRPTMSEVAAELEQIRLSKWARSCSLESHSSTGSFISRSSNLSIESSTTVRVEDVKQVKKSDSGRRGTFGKVNSGNEKIFSPTSVQDPWPSDSSLPSSNSLLSYANQSVRIHYSSAC